MTAVRRILRLLLTFSFVISLLPATAQVVTSTVQAGINPSDAAVNGTTNKTYVSNVCGNDPSCQSNGTVNVIDGATLTTQTVATGFSPYAIAVNPVTNKIYVVNYCGNDVTCLSPGTVTAIDGQTLITQTIGVGFYPYAVALNTVTNKIYVVNACGSDGTCFSPGSVTVIDGVTLANQTVAVGYAPITPAVNSTANQIYVTNYCGTNVNCSGLGTLTVIDGNTLNTQTVTTGYYPYGVAANPVTNQIYVANSCGNDEACADAGTVSVIDGKTLTAQAVAVQFYPYELAANSVTNQVYVENDCGTDPTCSGSGQPTVTVINGGTLSTNSFNVCLAGNFVEDVDVDSVHNKIYLPCQVGGGGGHYVYLLDGASNATTPIAVGDTPVTAAINPSTNTIYVPNHDDAAVSVIGGSTTLQLMSVTPCRLVDTRQVSGGGGPIPGGTFQTFNLPQLSQAKSCDDLSNASAYSLNVTVVPMGILGYLTIWPASQLLPPVSTLNSLDGRVKANAAVVVAGVNGAVSVFVSNTSDVVLDIDGYFAPASQSTLAFYPLTPCRVADTRNANLPSGLGPPSMMGGAPRDFPVLQSSCFHGISSPVAYSFNITAVPHVPLGYLTVWPAGQSQPGVSTLNSPTGTVVANAAIVPAGMGGDIDAFPSNDTDLVIDVNGYFAAPSQNGLSLYPAAPCRVLDTRQVGSGQPFVGELTTNVEGSICAPPNTAQTYVLNATVVPSVPLGYLTLWADGRPQPGVSTLNALDGAVTSNMALVPTTNGQIDAFATNLTQLILDISSYFAPAAGSQGPPSENGH